MLFAAISTTELSANVLSKAGSAQVLCRPIVGN